jgi:hypothetical protein
MLTYAQQQILNQSAMLTSFQCFFDDTHYQYTVGYGSSNVAGDAEGVEFLHDAIGHNYVFAPLTVSTNLAMEAAATTRQSSTAYGGVSNRAVDGNLDGAFSSNSVALTQYEQEPWWQVIAYISYQY